MPRYPEVTVKLVGEDGNAFSIIARVSREMRNQLKGKLSYEEINEAINSYQKEAMSGDYDHLLITTMDYVNAFGDEDEYDSDGYDRDGYDEDGYNRDGYDEYGYNRDGYDEDGYNRDGYDEYGYNRDGYDRYGYDEDGYDRYGYDDNGYDRDGFNYHGYDRDGFHKDGDDQWTDPAGGTHFGNINEGYDPAKMYE